MKRLLLSIVLFLIGFQILISQTTVTIGTGTSTQRYPLGNYFGYERSAALYSTTEMTTGGTITKLNWYATIARTTTVPIKIYLKETSNTTLTASTWATMISGATLVFDANNTSIIANAWNEFSLSTSFSYSGISNLMVLVEANYGGTGTGASSGTGVRYSTFTSMHQYWYQDTSPPTGNGTVSNSRPNIQFVITTSACSGTPTPGNTISSANPVCSGTNFTLSLQNATLGTGVTYQWQSGPSSSGPWTNIGTSTPTYTTSQTTATYYRCQVTCSGNTGTSTPVLQGDPAPPTTQASSITTSALSYTTATITWTVGSGNRRYAIINNVNTFTNPSGTGDVTVAGTTYSGSGEQIIYDGTGTSVSVTGLSPNTTYYVRVFDYLRCTGTPNTNYYQTSTATNNPGSFTTLALPTCPGSLGAGTVNIASLPYSATALTNCGNGNNITSSNITSVCGSSNYYGGEDKTFIFTPSSTGDYVFTLTSTSTYTAMMLYNGCPFSASCVGNVQSSGSGTKTMTLSLTSGTTYYLVVDTWPSPTCIPSFDLSIAAALPPACTTITTPANGATNVALAGSITFAAATGATSYDIYLSTGTPPTYHGNTTTTSYAYTGLSANTLYYVQIIPKNANGAASGCTITSFTTVPPPPANDNCATATAFPTVPTDGTCATLSNQSTLGATNSNVTPTGACTSNSGTPDDDIWFSFVAPATSVILEATWVSGLTDVYWQVFSGSCASSMVSILCTDTDTGGTLTGLTVGNTYYIRLYTYASSGSTVQNICIKTPPPPPANDNCATATAFPTVPTDGTCATLSNQSTLGATNSNVTPTGACTSNSGTPDDDIWFSFVAPATSVILEATWVSGLTDVYWQVFSGSCASSMVSILCTDTNTGGTLTGLTVGNTYYVRLYTYASSGSTVQNICIKTPPPLPDCATLNAPSNGATDVTLTTALTWTPAGTGGTPTSYKVYHGTANPPTTYNTVTAPTTTYTPTGRAYSTTYYWYVVPTNASGDAVGCNSTIYSYTTVAPPPPPANNDPSGAINVDQLLTSSCGSPLTGQTTESATETLPSTTCSIYTATSPIHDVWYKFVPQTPNLTVNVTTTTDVVLVVYLGDPTNGGTYVDCSDGTGGGETVSMTGLNVGKTYYYRVYPYLNSNVANFTTCVYGPEPASISLGTANTCTTARNILSTGSGKWLYITNTDGGVVAAFKDDNALGNVSTSFYINNGAVRVFNSIPYMDRNIEITPATNGAATVRLYYTAAELAALNAVADPDLTPATLQGYKVETTCSGTEGAGSPITQSGNGTSSGGNYVEFNVASFSTFFMQGTTVLPLELISFTGYADKSSNVLTWRTISEVNTDRFIVERSGDANYWTTVTEVNASGNSKEKLSYTATDNNPLAKSYYRLKIIDRDGRSNYSQSINIERKDSNFKLYAVSPNPNNGNFTISFNAPSTGKTKMMLINVIGEKVYTNEISCTMGENHFNIDVTGIPAGIYNLIIQNEKESLSSKVMIKR